MFLLKVAIAMAFLLQIAQIGMSWLCALSRQGVGAGAGAECWVLVQGRI